MLLVVISSHSQAITCNKPALSEKQLSDIIDAERRSNQLIPQKLISPSGESAKIKITRMECYYHYSEQVSKGPFIVFIINKDGNIASYQESGFTAKAGCNLKRKVFNQNELGEKLKYARAKDKSLPSEPKSPVVNMRRFNCMYTYTESADINTDNVFIFDSLGDIFEHRVNRNVRGLILK